MLRKFDGARSNSRFFAKSKVCFGSWLAMAALAAGPALAQSRARAPIDWQGHYRGTLACAKPCTGMEADLELSQIQGKTRFRLLEIFYGPKLATRASSGAAFWLKDGQRLSFSTRRGKRIAYVGRGYVVFVKAGRLRPGVKERGKLRKISDVAASAKPFFNQ